MSIILDGTTGVAAPGSSVSGNLNFTGTGNRITGDFSNATIANRLMFQTSTANSVTVVSAIPSGTGTQANFNLHNNSDPTNASDLRMWISSSEARFQSSLTGTGTYLPMTFYTGGSERVRIDTSGNVGIGTSSPAVVLHTYSANAGDPATSGTATTGVSARFQNSSVNFDIGTYGSGTCFIQPRLLGNNASNFSLVLNPNGGNVGIGTSSPIAIANQTSVTVSGTNAGRFDIRMGGVHTAQFLSTSTFADVGTLTSIPLTFTTNNTERARIDSSGNLLVGTTSDIPGINNTTTGSRIGGGVIISSINGSDAATFNRNTSDGAIVVFRRQGSVVGSISVTTSATAYNTSSDYRLKNIAGPVTNSGAYIDSLNPVEGTWKVDGSTFVGLIAHEAQEVSRTTVATGEKDGEQMQGMDYSNSEFIANIIAELQALRKRVAALEGK